MAELVEYENKNFKFSGKLTIYKASEVKRKISAILGEEKNFSGEFTVDLSSVESMDASFFQILIALRKSLEQKKCSLKIEKSSSSFDSILDVLVGVPYSEFEKTG